MSEYAHFYVGEQGKLFRSFKNLFIIKNKPFFTMVELLVVIAIIGLLAAILMPVLAKARDEGRKASCISNLKQLALANLQYSITYSRFAPFRNGTHSSGSPWSAGQHWFGYRDSPSENWDTSRGILAEYIDYRGELLQCPTANLLPMKGSSGMNGGTGGYGYNSYGVGSTAYFDGYTSSDSSSCWDNGGIKPVQLNTPSGTAMFADTASFKWGTTDLTAKSEITTPYSLWNVPADQLHVKKPGGDKMYGTIHFRHNGKTANISWADGHVSQEIMTFSWAWGGVDDPDMAKAGLGSFGPRDNTPFDPFGDDIPETFTP